MVAHDVSEHGASPNMTYGRLDVPAPSDTMANLTWSERAALNQQFAVEPALPMWLMYSCPYAPKGKNYDCQSRNKEALDYRSTFLANERTLSQEHGVSQVRMLPIAAQWQCSEPARHRPKGLCCC